MTDISLNVSITYDELHTKGDYFYKTILNNILMFDHKFNEVFFIVDKFMKTSLTDKDCKKLKEKYIEKLCEEIKKNNITDTVNIYETDYSSNDSIYVKISNDIFGYNILPDRNKLYKNMLVYMFAFGLCKTRYLVHFDGNKQFVKTESKTNFIDHSIDLLNENKKVYAVCSRNRHGKICIETQIKESLIMTNRDRLKAGGISNAKKNKPLKIKNIEELLSNYQISHFSLMCFVTDMNKMNQILSYIPDRIKEHGKDILQKQTEGLFEKIILKNNKNHYSIFLREKDTNFMIKG